MKTIIVFSVLICALLAFVAAEERVASSNIKIELFSGSNSHWIAVAVQNAIVDTSSVQIKDSSSKSSWASMEYTEGWGFWTFSALTKVEFPLSLLLTSVNGDQVTVSNIASLNAGIINTQVQYPITVPAHTSAPVSTTPVTAATSKKHTSAPTSKPTKAPTAAPASKHTAAPTTAAPSKHTAAPTTAAPSKHTTAATVAPTKQAATSAGKSTSASTISSASGCSAPLKLMVPLYTYPGSSWDSVASGASLVPTVAIINPDSGPGNGPDSSYNSYMAKLNAAGVEMIGYVHTSYGARAIADVKADIDQYASEFPLLVGIFLDEAAATASEVAYYQELYTYIMSFPGWTYDVINPGTVPTSGYESVATQIVSFEDTGSKFSASANPSFASCSNKNQYVMISYAATSASSMQAEISAAKSKGYYGWVYVTDGAAGGSTYNSLTSYYATEAAYIASLN